MRFLLSLLVAIFFATPATAVQMPIAFTNSLTNPGHIFNPMTEYGGTVRYFIDPNSALMTVVINNVPYSVDWNSVIEEAVSEWRAALSTSNLSLTRVTNRAQANVVIATATDPPSASTSTVLAGTIPTHNGLPTTITFYSNQFQNYLGGHEATLALQFLRDQTIQGLLSFIVKRIAKHELGHALGLAHTQARSHFFVEVQVQDNQLRTPIMIGNLFYYLRTMFAFVNNMGDIPDEYFVPDPSQTLLTNDYIEVTPEEGDAVQTLMRTQQATCGSLLLCIKPPYIHDGDGDDSYG
ncbi:hypothetical protein [Pandoraea pulmonicola]|uniref:Matrixin n=1 Tax=Pandoraea pulmonicola TaxID=93221 RepID=A0AAJ4Z9P8_PANPU|nr:hypothetical protein [Pandoraea pulmonicola]AJC21794.1 hypothetical protein RO07_17240 [Pandoraea pulmonicola]SUA89307.1 Uncharacterised protein [Pandoraea pulmonicola]